MYGKIDKYGIYADIYDFREENSVNRGIPKHLIILS